MKRRVFERIVALIVIVGLLSPPLPLLAAPHAVSLRAGTPVTVHATRDISSGRVRTGDTVFFTVQNPVIVDGVTVIEPGAQARGIVRLAKHASGLGRNGKLVLAIDSVTAVDGSQIPLRARHEVQRGGNNVVLAVGLAVFVSVFALFIQGREAVVKSSRSFDVFVDTDVDFHVADDGRVVTDTAARPYTPLANPPGPPAAGAASTVIYRTLTCPSVNDAGQPQQPTTEFSSDTPRILLWFQLQPGPSARSCAVLFYQGNHMQCKSNAFIPAGLDHGCAGMAAGRGGFAIGDWHADVYEGGRKLATQYFKVSYQPSH